MTDNEANPEGKRKPGRATGFLDDLGDALRATGAQATRLADLAAAQATLEKVKLDLYRAHAALGKAVTEVWTRTPGEAIGPDHAACTQARARVLDVTKRIAEIEARIAALRAE